MRKIKDFLEKFEDLKNLIYAIPILLGFITSAILWLFETKLFVIALFVVGIVLLILEFYILFHKKIVKTSSVPDENGIPGERKVKAFSKQTRIAASIGILIITILVIGAALIRHYEGVNKVIILVTKFGGPDQNKYAVNDTIIEKLQRATKEFKDIKIKSVNREIKVEEGSKRAIAIGKMKNANIVIWGNYHSTGKTVRLSFHFEIIRELPSYYLPEADKTLKASISELDSFQFQEDLADELSSFVLITSGLAFYKANDWKGAIKRFNLALNSNDAKNNALIYSSAFFSRGYSYFQIEEYEKSIYDFSKVIQFEPDYALAYNNRGSAYVSISNYDKAIDDFTKAINLRASNEDFYYNRGLAYKAKGLDDQALTDYSQVINLKPDYVDAYLKRGNIKVAKGDYNQAIEDYTKAINLKPDCAEAYINRGIAYNKKGNYDQGIAEYLQAINIKPDSAEAYFNYGNAKADKGDYDQAIENYTKAINLKPDYAEAYNNRGSIKADKGDYDQAIEDYTKAINLKPDYSLSYYNRGEIYQKIGKIGLAILDFNMAKKLGYDPFKK